MTPLEDDILFWAVAVLEPSGERKAALNAGRQGFDVYLPRVLTVNKRGLPAVQWMFPRYMFVKIVDQWNVLRSTFGIQDLITFGKEVGKLPPNFIQGLKDREVPWDDDVQVIDIRTNRQKANGYQAGDIVRATEKAGPWEGLVGEVASCPQGRIKVLFDIMGRRTPIEVAPDQVALV